MCGQIKAWCTYGKDGSVGADEDAGHNGGFLGEGEEYAGDCQDDAEEDKPVVEIVYKGSNVHGWREHQDGGHQNSNLRKRNGLGGLHEVYLYFKGWQEDRDDWNSKEEPENCGKGSSNQATNCSQREVDIVAPAAAYVEQNEADETASIETKYELRRDEEPGERLENVVISLAPVSCKGHQKANKDSKPTDNVGDDVSVVGA